MTSSDFSWRQSVKDHCANSERPLVCIVGATASGKTSFSIDLCLHLQNEGFSPEVLNADSRQLFRSMDIGTAKIMTEEMQGVPHHLIDVVNPNEEVTVGWYQKKATESIEEILQREGIPVLVGGSMLYVSSIIDELTLAGASDEKVRQRLEKEYEREGGEAMHRRLQECDPTAAARIHPNNMPHLVRAMEIWECSSVSRSDTFKDDELHTQASSEAFDTLILGVQRPREQLHSRINRRCAAMFEEGWIDEVQKLLDSGYTKQDPGMKSHGYKEIMHYLETGEPDSLEDLQESIAAKSRQFARRQCTWWRGDTRIHWINDY